MMGTRTDTAPLAYIQVSPIGESPPLLIGAAVKRLLLTKCPILTSKVMNFMSSDPLATKPVTCRIIGYFAADGLARSCDLQAVQAMVTPSTLVSVVTPEGPEPSNLDDTQDQSEAALEVIDTLRLRLSALLSHSVQIGTTADAISYCKYRRRRSQIMKENLKVYIGSSETVTPETEQGDPSGHCKRLRTSLTIHSTQHETGSTLRHIRRIAKELTCRLHVIEVAKFLALHGIHADAALECTVHEWAMNAAVCNEPIFIVINHLQSLGRLRTSIADATVPVLTSMVSFLQTLARSMSQKRQVPFPSRKCPLYNPGATHGCVFEVRIGFVALATCQPHDKEVLSLLPGGETYRIPDPVQLSRVQQQEFSFDLVGGNVEAKLALQDGLDTSQARLLRHFGLSPPSGILLYGPPGTGKTLLARTVATQSGCLFLSLQASDIVRSEVGNSEKLVVSAFDTARAQPPAVVFIDEFQALFTERRMSGNSQLASTLLQCMDDINRWQDSEREATGLSHRIVVLAATNTPWSVDKAFLRAGRFDKVVHVGLPTEEERQSILKLHIGRMRITKTVSESLFRDLAAQTPGFSGADLAALCRAAAVQCLREEGADGAVDVSHFVAALGVDVKASSENTPKMQWAQRV